MHKTYKLIVHNIGYTYLFSKIRNLCKADQCYTYIRNELGYIFNNCIYLNSYFSSKLRPVLYILLSSETCQINYI